MSTSIKPFLAPDFTLNTFEGAPVTLSDYQNDRNVVLVFNRGFF